MSAPRNTDPWFELARHASPLAMVAMGLIGTAYNVNFSALVLFTGILWLFLLY